MQFPRQFLSSNLQSDFPHKEHSLLYSPCEKHPVRFSEDELASEPELTRLFSEHLTSSTLGTREFRPSHCPVESKQEGTGKWQHRRGGENQRKNET